LRETRAVVLLSSHCDSSAMYININIVYIT